MHTDPHLVTFDNTRQTCSTAEEMTLLDNEHLVVTAYGVEVTSQVCCSDKHSMKCFGTRPAGTHCEPSPRASADWWASTGMKTVISCRDQGKRKRGSKEKGSVTKKEKRVDRRREGSLHTPHTFTIHTPLFSRPQLENGASVVTNVTISYKDPLCGGTQTLGSEDVEVWEDTLLATKITSRRFTQLSTGQPFLSVRIVTPWTEGTGICIDGCPTGDEGKTCLMMLALHFCTSGS